MKNVLIFILVIYVIKNETIGSEFSFVYWIKHGATYTDWYFSRTVIHPPDNIRINNSVEI